MYCIYKMYCSNCCIQFKTKRIYETHLKSNKHLKNTNNDLKFKCDCGKFFSHRQSLSLHRKNCTIHTNPPIEYSNTTLVSTLIKTLQERDKQIEINKQEMDTLRKQVETLLEKSTSNPTGNTTTNTTNNGNVHSQANIGNIIVVNSFGHENIDHLTDQIICKIIKTAPFTSVPQLIEKIHFDPDHPENHNIKITNKKLNYAEIVKNNKWVTANKKKIIDDVIQKSYDLLDDKYTDNKDDISEKRQERFHNFQEKYEQADEELLRNIKNDVDLLLINGTN
jgi:hypothetical protein